MNGFPLGASLRSAPVELERAFGERICSNSRTESSGERYCPARPRQWPVSRKRPGPADTSIVLTTAHGILSFALSFAIRFADSTKPDRSRGEVASGSNRRKALSKAVSAIQRAKLILEQTLGCWKQKKKKRGEEDMVLVFL